MASCACDDASATGFDNSAHAPQLLLHDVTLHNFKSYGPCVVAGPFDQHQTTIVGPNGAGKSCLVEGIAWALGAQHASQAPSLASLVHRSASGNGSASVVVKFRTAPSAGSEQHRLVVERRIVGGRRSEWRLQECSCGATDDAALPWVCATCKVISMKRDTLRDALRRLLHHDIDRPERLVVHQSTALSLAQKSPTDLLAFLEGVIGTDALRDGVEREAARALALQTTLHGHEQALAAERLAEGRHAPCMLAFQTLQAGRAKLEGMKRAHLRREVRFHEVVLHASARAVRDADDAVRNGRAEAEAAEACLLYTSPSPRES